MGNDFETFMEEFNAFLGDAIEGDIYNLHFDIAPSDNWFDGICELRTTAAAAIENNRGDIRRALEAFVAIDNAVNGIDVTTIDANPFLIDAKVDAEDMAYKAIWHAFELALAKELANAIVEARYQAYHFVNECLDGVDYKG